MDTVAADPAPLMRELVRLTAAEGFRITRSSPEEGYLETDWFDVEAGRAGGARTLAPERAVRLRFFADLVGIRETQLASEAVYRRTVDPSLPPREAEVIAPPGHPGTAILRRILGALKDQYP